jgi:hypothetical protein
VLVRSYQAATELMEQIGAAEEMNAKQDRGEKRNKPK